MNKPEKRNGKRPTEAQGETVVPAVQGFKDVRLVGQLRQELQAVGTERDRAGNRQRFYDQDATWLLLYFFTPTVTSLRGLQQLSTLTKVQQRWGVRRTALGTVSEAATVFDATRLQDVIECSFHTAYAFRRQAGWPCARVVM